MKLSATFGHICITEVCIPFVIGCADSLQARRNLCQDWWALITRSFSNDETTAYSEKLSVWIGFEAWVTANSHLYVWIWSIWVMSVKVTACGHSRPEPSLLLNSSKLSEMRVWMTEARNSFRTQREEGEYGFVYHIFFNRVIYETNVTYQHRWQSQKS